MDENKNDSKTKEMKNITIVINLNFGEEPNRRTITKKQMETFNIIKDELRRRGVSPTIGELAAKLGLDSLRSVTQRLDSLQRHGLITRERWKTRGIKIAAK
jgi:SOS-response transcriptional repressor LexA